MVKSFGVWQVIDEIGIIGKINPVYDYTIDKTQLWDIFDEDGVLVYEWPVHLSQKSWMTESMLIDLFDAMVFAQKYFATENNTTTKDISWEKTIPMLKNIEL